MDDNQKQKLSAYSKLKFDGTVGSNQLEDCDYDNMMKFIKTTFPTSLKVKKELEQTMKRVRWILMDFILSISPRNNVK